MFFYILFQSSHFGNYEKNRGGFEKLYRKMSDQTWEQAIDLVKYMGKRGGHMNFRLRRDEMVSKVLEFIQSIVNTFLFTNIYIYIQ